MYKTLVVTEASESVPSDLSVISFDQYLSDYPKKGEPPTRIINLCETEPYLSRGYYCSLLAESRRHRVLPSVSTINDLRNREESSHLVPKPLLPDGAGGPSFPEVLNIYLGWTEEEGWRKIARDLFDRYPAPLLQARFIPGPQGMAVAVERLSLRALPPADRQVFFERLRIFTSKVWRTPGRRPRPRWDMLILHNPGEQNAPSDEEAVKRFVKAASKVGISADLARTGDLKHLTSYDALFIRETTSIDHPTYRLARKAEKEGLVVMDDPTSILRCCNKIFLQDAFSYHKVSAPETLVLAGATPRDIDRVEASIPYPVVLKMPESSFSKGVWRAENRPELIEKLHRMLERSALALVQEYIYTEFDWRIGVLNGRAIYACKYFMARDHWQIYNHDSRRRSGQSGGFKTLPTFEVPRPVLDAALKAASIIGNGLYGVDVKQKDNQIYVIEVNDNPSIDHGVEDAYLGNELYMIIMQEFVNRLEKRGRE